MRVCLYRPFEPIQPKQRSHFGISTIFAIDERDMPPSFPSSDLMRVQVE